MEKPESKLPKKNKALLIVTYSFTSLLALFLVFAFVPKLIDNYLGIIRGLDVNHFDGWDGLVMELTFYLFIIGYLFSFKKRFTGGIILVLTSIVQMAPFLIIEGNLGSLIFGIPILISGVLLLFTYRYYR